MSRPASDRIHLAGLEVETRIGIHAWERRVRQRLRLDLELPVDARPAAASDDIGDALDYAAVAIRVREHCAKADWLLIERLAEAVCELLLAEFRLPWVALRVTKPGAVADCAGVTLAVTRTARPSADASATRPTTPGHRD